MNTGKIDGTAEAWESGALGQEEEHAECVSTELALKIDDNLGLQMISIRLPKELIEEFKMIASYHGLGYQPLMRDALTRFAKAEIKLMAIQAFNEKNAKGKILANANTDDSKPSSQTKKVA